MLLVAEVLVDDGLRHPPARRGQAVQLRAGHCRRAHLGTQQHGYVGALDRARRSQPRAEAQLAGAIAYHWMVHGHARETLERLVHTEVLGAGRRCFLVTDNGSSFIANQFGEKVQELNETEEGVLVHSFDLDELEHIRSAWGTFRDRRPNLYGAIKTLDGSLES